LQSFDQIKNPLRDYAANLIQAHRDFLESDFFKDDEKRFQNILGDIVDINQFAKDKESKAGFNQIVSDLLTRL